MKTSLNLTELAQTIEARAESKRDIVVNTSRLRTDGASLGLFNDDLGGEFGETMEINDIAHHQIADRLRIPQKYYARMRAESPRLLSDNVNHWFINNPEDRMIRTLDGKARAFLSSRYQRIDNEEIAAMVLPILGEQESIEIVSCAITESRMYIKAVFPRLEGEVKRGDVVQGGVVISNSEVGMGAVKIEPLIYRLVCLNGMIIPDSSYRARHLGSAVSIDGAYEVLSDETLKADDNVKLLKVRDVLRASLDQTRFATHLDKMRGITDEKIEGNPIKAIEVLSKKFSFNESEKGGILRHLIEGGDLTRWGVLNAVTRTSQDVEDYDRATDLEVAGGIILNMSTSDFRPIATAA